MYIQWCVKGIAGKTSKKSSSGITKQEGFDLVQFDHGIISNWWRHKGTISPNDIASELTPSNLDRHLHDYTKYGAQSPFISMSAGAVLHDAATQSVAVYSAIDTALGFATNFWKHPGALFD